MIEPHPLIAGRLLTLYRPVPYHFCDYIEDRATGYGVMNEPELFKAAGDGDVGAVQAILTEGVQVDAANPNGETSLMCAASKGRLDVVRILLSAGADVNAQRADGMTALIYAAFFSRADVVQLLIDSGADSDARDRLGMRALDWARSKGATETVNILQGAAAPGARQPATHHEAGREIRSEEVLDLPEVDSVAVTDDLTDGTLDLPAPQGLPTHARHAQPLQRSAKPPAAEPVESSQTGKANQGGIEHFDTPASASAVTSNDEILVLPEASSVTTPDDLADRMLELSGEKKLSAVARRVSSDEISHPELPPSNSGTEMGDGAEYNVSRETNSQTPITWFHYACLFLSFMIISGTVTWVIFRENRSQPDNQPVNSGVAALLSPVPGEVPQAPPKSDDDTALTAALTGWLEATKARDVEEQMSFYAPGLRAYYRKRSVPSRVVRADKAELFGRARRVEVSVGEPEIRYGKASPTASVRFRKSYSIEFDSGGRRGEVIQELIWRKTEEGWKIISERDITVVR